VNTAASRATPENERSGGLRAVSLIATFAGAVGSIALTLYAISRNPSVLLMLLFVVWVLAPFAVLLLAHWFSRPWSSLARLTVDGLMIALPLVSLLIYGHRVLRPPKSTGAFVFVAVPPLSVIVVLVTISLVRLTQFRKP